MPRVKRITFPGGFYHIYNRGFKKEKIFNSSEDYEKFFTVLEKILEKGEWIIYAYCLMPNHYHFLVEEKNTSVSKLFSRLFTSYSQFFNKKYNRQGPLFQDRFKSKLVQKDSYFTYVSRYIHLNPYFAGLVSNPEKYQYSSLKDYLRHSQRKIINLDKISVLIGKNLKTMENYFNFVRDGMNQNIEEFNPFINKKDIIGSNVYSAHKKKR